jgi:major capsid protein gp7
MAVITPGAMTYSEWGLRHDPTGKISTLVDLLSQQNGIVDDMLTVECQSGNAYEYTQVVKLPTPARRSYNVGVPITQAGVAKQTAVCMEYGDWVQFDASLAELGGTLAELRAQEVALHMEGLSQLVATDLFYANRSLDPTQLTGLANIYNTINPANSPIASNVIDCGGTGSTNTSMWLITWGPKHIHALFPKGTQAGLKHEDFGKGWGLDNSTPQMQLPVYRDYLSWKLGLAVHDWRFGVRACNIDVTQLSGGSAANLINTLVRMTQRMPIQPAGVGPVQDSDAPDKIVMGRSAIYCNRTIATYLDLQAMNKTNVLLKMEEWDGKAVTTFRSIPIRVVDVISTSESWVQ